ncbi:platelet-activating factor receptor isoform X2 [Dendropsophus ebraccatus]|uniref:platelet-activating factor receptor isoform X2 n=1 Tax=Dendropsophus ebraccatus TaxID=150705 RepID=UPI003831504F
MSLQENNSSDDPCDVDSEFRYSLFTVSYSIIFVIGFIANSYVLWVFAKVYPSKRLSEIKIFMINLTVADLLFLVTLPLWIVYYNYRGDWIMPDFLCNVAGCFFFINTYCSVAFLGVISYNRCQAVTRPVETAQSTARCKAICISTCVWTLVFCSSLYFLIFPGTNQMQTAEGHNYTQCFEGYNIENRDPVAAINFFLIAAFFFVFLFILVCNLVIFKTLVMQPVQPRKSAEMKRRALYMVGTVLGVFVICFVPHHIVHGPWTLTVLRLWHERDCRFRQTLNDAHQITLCLMSTNCMLDPIIYCFLTKKFRKHLSERIQSMKRSRGDKPQVMEEVQKISIAPMDTGRRS